jgi:hypothetical protein
MDVNELINQALELISAGKNDKARGLIKQALDIDPEDVRAWALMVQVSKNPEEEISAIRAVLRLKPDDQWAQRYLAELVDKEAIKRVMDLIELDKKKQALYLLDQIIGRSPNNPDAWVLKARLAGNREKAIEALEHVLRLRPDDERSRQYLTRLLSEQRARQRTQEEDQTGEPEKKEKRKGFFQPRTERKMPSSDLIMGLMGAVLLLSLVCLVVVYPMLPCDQRILGDLWLACCDDSCVEISEVGCMDLIDRALTVSDIGCQQIGSNEICYGNDDIDATIIPIYEGQFDIAGDVIPIEGVQKFYTLPLDEDNNRWGVAVLKVQANMVGTNPGQNVTFLVFGDTDVDNTSGDMSAFYFTTGITGVTCNQESIDGILIETPDGSEITLQANGVNILLKGDALLEAQPGEEMTVSMLKGSANVRAEGVEQEVSAGYKVSVPLNEEGKPVGGPSKPEPSTPGCLITGVGCPAKTPTPVDTSIPTNTPVPVTPGQPTNTSVPLSTNTSAPLPTKTSPPGATNTSPPGATNTSPPPATNTPPPPPPTATNTPVTGSCSDITVSPGGSGGQFNITNNYSSAIVITEITLSWPVDPNGRWKHTLLDGQNIQSGNFDTSPASDVLVTDASRRTIQVGVTKTIEFGFQNPPASTGYSVTITFDVGCSKTRSQ